MAEEPRPRSLRLVDDGDGVLLVAGELDLSGAAALRGRLASTPAVAVVDLRAVSFIDAAGLRAIVEARPALTLRAPSPAVRRLLDIVQLTDAFVIEPGAPARPS